ncbi:MAG: cyclic nucleotide-binding domain-containing protein [Endomicrobiales bacterium]
MDKVTLLKSVFVFSGLEDSLLAEIARHLKEAEFPRGQEIFRQQGSADAFFIIDTGEVTISKVLGPGQEKLLAVLGPGSVFGEMAFFSDSPRTANARARTDAVLFKIERSDFMHFIQTEPKAGLRVLSGLLQVAMDRLEQTSRELATIYQTGKVISSGRRLSEVAAGIRDELLLAVPEAENGAIFLYNEFNEEYDPVAAPEGTKEISPASPLLVRVKEKLGEVIINDPGEAGAPVEEFLAGARTVLLSPIVKEVKILGFIVLWNAHQAGVFRTSHSLLVSSVGGQLAEAAENLRHQQEERDRRRLNNARQGY